MYIIVIRFFDKLKNEVLDVGLFFGEFRDDKYK